MVTENNKLKQWEYKYYECLALEFNDPKYFEAHHLLVLTFMLETDGYSNEYFSATINLLKEFLNDSITPQPFQDKFRTSKINYNVNNNSINKDIDKFKWNITILDVRTDEADQYFQDIRLWALDVLTVIESARS